MDYFVVQCYVASNLKTFLMLSLEIADGKGRGMWLLETSPVYSEDLSSDQYCQVKIMAV